MKVPIPEPAVSLEQNPTEFRRALGLFDSIMIVAGIMVGSGIFIVSAEITRQAGSAGWLLVA
jgi:APA family basic amino acid/polyamine antiporter